MPEQQSDLRAVAMPRLLVRHVVEADRPRFVELFCDEGFMTFSNGVLSLSEANERFDRMILRCAEVSFAKQAIVDLSSGVVVGYTGVDWIDLEGHRWLEWGYRLVPAARGKGYATEATAALLVRAAGEYSGDLLAIIHPDNHPSQNVSRKLGFRWWKTAEVNGELRNIYRMRLPTAGS
ncbi:RimJ/RimL family protein N-acetyltransferase [Micromonospora vinacea]|uniref:RimJ/RimL family protein N-acetyltransferase n=1 Tax=Micromonospora vinacea TaxID=709878 RepID=A0ABS0KB89_9ACTN|nr:GNAT family N-acetyltransferase [Micromonospora vinacea]MBG6105904.1 RimJ/RimL family protein N-acetyltransferase [Micromonospora vinacea]